jgi:hypothetical protein
MTTAAPDVTVWPFTDLDVEVPCDILDPPPDACDKPAGWVARWYAPCHDKRVHALMCDRHKDYLMGRGLWCCPAHGGLYLPLEVSVDAL